jgi:hypothetical protein
MLIVPGLVFGFVTWFIRSLASGRTQTVNAQCVEKGNSPNELMLLHKMVPRT